MVSVKIPLLMCLATVLLPAPPGHAAGAPASESAPAKKEKKPRTAKPAAKLMAPEGSSETAAARSARLKRECKGRPNAGACTGYTD